MLWLVTPLALAAPTCDADDLLGCVQEALALRTEAPVDAAAMLTIACDRGLPDACSTLGTMKASGELGAADPDGALALYRRACLDGSHHGCARATSALVRTDAPAAAKLLESACARDVSAACEDLGALYANGTGVPRDDAQAVALYRRACDMPGRSCRQLGVRTIEGRGVSQDVGGGLRLLEATCMAGSAQTCKLLVGYLTDPGITSPDLGRLASARQAGCTAGNAWCCSGLGFQLYQGNGLPADQEGGLRLLEKGCEGGEGAACGGLGFHYREAGDLEAAREWFAKGCMAQLEQACIDLTMLNQR